jgi:hypothetical protein
MQASRTLTVPSAAGSAGQLQLGEAANLFGLSDDLLPNEQPFSIQIGIHQAFCGFKGPCACAIIPAGIPMVEGASKRIMIPLEETRLGGWTLCPLSQQIARYLAREELASRSTGMTLFADMIGKRLTTIIDLHHGPQAELLLTKTLPALNTGDIVILKVGN